MGRAISGEAAVSDSLQDAYTAVFSPASGVPDTAPPERQPEPASTGPDQPETRLLRRVTPRLPLADDGSLQAGALAATADPEPVIRREEVPVPDSSAGEPAAPPDSGAPQQEEPEDDTTTAAASYVYTMPAVPENASLEQRNLGFDHVNPLRGRMTSGFEWREHPVSGGNKFHYGVDLAAEWGSDICAFADGEVYATGESSTLGKYVMLQHDGGYVTLYAHCSAVTTGGGRVSMGEKIAEVGDTGVATGPHLHFELHDGELYLNPIYYIEVE
ncbi:MAG: peptidoglycan DD-metalloendopeptidase family protein [Oscillospiraceae bacterium]|jgi:murein DD-endopeptidase MepM/ murein hydrolase activator NlpD|nr:peptidoglycan DD-metalloendopeptidase family protein [Oscillospiraceae bacterium]